MVLDQVGFKPKILFVENIANVSYNLAKHLREYGCDVTILTRFNPKAGRFDLCCQEIGEKGIDVFACGNAYQKSFVYLKRILGFDVDIIHSHQAFVQSSYCLASKLIGKTQKVIIHCHGSDVRKVMQGQKWGWLVKSNLALADHVFVSTPDLLDYYEQAEYLPNPVDVEHFKPQKSSIDLHCGHDYAILAPARQEWKLKHQDYLIKALAILVKGGYDCNLTMITYGLDGLNAQNLVGKLGLENHVSFLSVIHPNEMVDYYNAADFVFDQIGLRAMGLVSLEALSCNKPVLSDFQYSKAYVNGPPVDVVSCPEDIALKIIYRLNSKREDFRKWVVDNHSYGVILPRLIKTYEEILEK